MAQLSRMLQTAATQDENATSTVLRSGRLDKTGAVLGGGKAGGKLSTLPSAQPTARKALGNITNKPAAGTGQTSSMKGKPEGPRRALNDITNAVSAKRNTGEKQNVDQPEAIKTMQAPVQQQQQARLAAPVGRQQASVKTLEAEAQTGMAAAEAALQQKAEQYAMDGTEQLAGRGWLQQEAERKQREEADIARRISAYAVPQWGGFAKAMHVVSDTEDDVTPVKAPASPMGRRCQAVVSGALSTEAGASYASSMLNFSPERALDLLPDLDFFGMQPDLTPPLAGAAPNRGPPIAKCTWSGLE